MVLLKFLFIVLLVLQSGHSKDTDDSIVKVDYMTEHEFLEKFVPKTDRKYSKMRKQLPDGGFEILHRTLESESINGNFLLDKNDALEYGTFEVDRPGDEKDFAVIVQRVSDQSGKLRLVYRILEDVVEEEDERRLLKQLPEEIETAKRRRLTTTFSVKFFYTKRVEDKIGDGDLGTHVSQAFNELNAALNNSDVDFEAVEYGNEQLINLDECTEAYKNNMAKYLDCFIATVQQLGSMEPDLNECFCHAYPNYNSIDWPFEDYYDYHGRKMGQNVSLERCKQTCQYLPNCKYITHNAQSGSCNLSSGNNDCIKVSGSPSTLDGIYKLTSHKSSEDYPVYQYLKQNAGEREQFVYWSPLYGGQWQIDTDYDASSKNAYFPRGTQTLPVSHGQYDVNSTWQTVYTSKIESVVCPNLYWETQNDCVIQNHAANQFYASTWGPYNEPKKAADDCKAICGADDQCGAYSYNDCTSCPVCMYYEHSYVNSIPTFHGCPGDRKFEIKTLPASFTQEIFEAVSSSECPDDNGKSLPLCDASQMSNGQLCDSDSGDDVNQSDRNNCGFYDVFKYKRYLTYPAAAAADPEGVTVSTTRCGDDWSDANTKCGQTCPVVGGCPGGETCHGNLSTTPCEPAAVQSENSETCDCGLVDYYKKKIWPSTPSFPQQIFEAVSSSECPDDNGKSLPLCDASQMSNGQLCESDSGDDVDQSDRNNCGGYDVFRYNGFFEAVSSSDCPSDNGKDLPQCYGSQMSIGQLCGSHAEDSVNQPSRDNCGNYDVFRYTVSPTFAKTYDGRCRYGNNKHDLLFALTTATISACMTACVENPSCTAFDFKKDNNACTLYEKGPYTSGGGQENTTCYVPKTAVEGNMSFLTFEEGDNGGVGRSREINSNVYQYSNRDNMYAIGRVEDITKVGQYTFGHEVGHLMGISHGMKRKKIDDNGVEQGSLQDGVPQGEWLDHYTDAGDNGHLIQCGGTARTLLTYGAGPGYVFNMGKYVITRGNCQTLGQNCEYIDKEADCATAASWLSLSNNVEIQTGGRPRGCYYNHDGNNENVEFNLSLLSIADVQNMDNICKCPNDYYCSKYSGKRVLHYSNPDIRYNGLPTGRKEGGAGVKSVATEKIRESLPVISNLRRLLKTRKL